MLKTGTTQIKRIVTLQFVASIVIAGLCWLVDRSYGLPVLVGALIGSIASGYFAWKVFSKQKETESTQILTTYYGAEVGKIILTVMLFVTAFSVIKQLNVVALMCAYLIITMIPMLVSFFINTDKEDANTNWRDDNVE